MLTQSFGIIWMWDMRSPSTALAYTWEVASILDPASDISSNSKPYRQASLFPVHYELSASVAASVRITEDEAAPNKAASIRTHRIKSQHITSNADLPRTSRLRASSSPSALTSKCQCSHRFWKPMTSISPCTGHFG